MNDLERQWRDYPTSPAPVDKLLLAGRSAAAAEARRKRRIRPMFAIAGAGALAIAVAGGITTVVDSGGGGGTTARGEAAGEPMVFRAGLSAPDSCDELLASYVRRGTAEVTPWGWPSAEPYEPTTVFDEPQADAAAGSQARVEGQKNSATGTNVQEDGVDEPDTVKADGDLLVRMQGPRLRTYDVSGDRVRELGEIPVLGLENPELLLSDDSAVVIGEEAGTAGTDHAVTRVTRVDLADPAAPEVAGVTSYESELLSARQHGSTIRLVLAAGLPSLDFVQPGADRTEAEALRENKEVVEASTLTDWLPTYDPGDGEQQLLDCAEVALPENDRVGLDTVSVVGFDASEVSEPDPVGLAGATTIAYESADHLYLASSDASLAWGTDGDGTSYLFDFGLEGTSARHLASGEVEGTIRDRWSLDEADDVLRVAVGPSSETGNFNSVITFARHGEDLVAQGRVDRLGVNEEIQSVRWFDDLAILVTFRRIDPLYTVDLTDPAKPRLLGKLKIPGFSSYLHPLGEHRIIGVGEGPVPGGTDESAWGAQVGLFSTRDLSEVRRLDVRSFAPYSEPLAGEDPRSFTWLPGHRVALTVVQEGRQTRLVELRPRGGKLDVSSEVVEYGSDAEQVRAVPLHDGRVVLVTGEDVAFHRL